MPFGIGGGAFGVRAGISTRGIGVGAGPFSAGTSWRGNGSGSGGAGLIAWLIVAAILFFITAWPFLLGTFIAVQPGAWNPSTERLVTGLCFEVVYVAALVGWFFYAREQRTSRVAQEARRTAELAASGVVYETTSWRSTVYRHGNCSVSPRPPGRNHGLHPVLARGVDRLPPFRPHHHHRRNPHCPLPTPTAS